MERERDRERESAICIYIYMLADSCSQCWFLLHFTRSLSHTTFAHTISHTQLCHTHTIFLCHPPSFTHNFVTDTIFLCHTPSFTHHFVAHNSSHRTCFTSRSSITSFVFPSFPVPPINICGSLLEEVDLWCFPVLEFVYRIYHNLIYV